MLNKADYVARIANATGVQLTIITHELAIDYIEQAAPFAGADAPEFERAIKSAQMAVGNLIDTLDMQYALSKTLMLIYVYMNKLLMSAYFSKTREPLDEAAEIMQTLLSGWRQIEHNGDGDRALMENAQQIYAGLTYRRAGLAEYVEEDGARGFKA